MRSVRKPWAAWLTGFAVLAGLLVQAALGMPARLAMVQAAPVCSVAHGGGAENVPDRPAHDHAHCTLCQAPAGPPLLAVILQPEPPFGYAFVEQALAARHPFVAVVATGFLSRAPPVLA